MNKFLLFSNQNTKPLEFIQWNVQNTLESGIVVPVGIIVLVGIFVKINKRTGWNKHTGWKIQPKYCLIIPILLVNFLKSFEV